jgi:hypothetical protein
VSFGYGFEGASLGEGVAALGRGARVPRVRPNLVCTTAGITRGLREPLEPVSVSYFFDDCICSFSTMRAEQPRVKIRQSYESYGRLRERVPVPRPHQIEQRWLTFLVSVTKSSCNACVLTGSRSSSINSFNGRCAIFFFGELRGPPKIVFSLKSNA